ncbi:LuxR C-terminal-related transcriptional regulator [Candidatus Chloroploca asiatica]|uniref:HTH luxR-type domain-containing protein n=1 Tax=Candidatus Chloroploca asiatica TaxID=1506545 RepID=A0A2H3KIU5_9CHLR|nr:LuxR C-terminal-related transcriptional regulator [Candidatus Chloroploca asiatica]PDV97068.1 hypothetical protein A9Q02_19515 [Candidatus Chloroploca asiatica]
MTYALPLLVPTKLTMPQLRDTLVLRTDLLARLGPHPSTRLTLVVAPAGFGKSTLVAQWLTRRSPQQPAVAWVTLDEHDQDGPHFLAYLVGAVTRVLSDACASTVALLKTSASPLYVMLRALLVDLSQLSTPLILVLDDYHVITSEAVHQTVAYLVRNLPPQCSVVLISRTDPPLPLGRLQAEHEVTEIRADDLRFTKAEAETFLVKMTGHMPSHQALNLVLQQTEGWAIALQMAALSQFERTGYDHLPVKANRQIAEYLADEVLAQQTDEVQQILLRLALPSRFCAHLGATLVGLAPADAFSGANGRKETGRSGSPSLAGKQTSTADPGHLWMAEQIEQLVQANLFLAPLDHEQRWYRFHPLFRDLLLRRLHLASGEDGVRALHRQAAHWFARNDALEEAITHFLAAGDEPGAADVIEQHFNAAIIQQFQVWMPPRLLNLLPPTLIAQRPGLTFLTARKGSINLNLAQLATGLEQIDAQLAATSPDETILPWPTFLADRDNLKGILCYWQGRTTEACQLLEHAAHHGSAFTVVRQALIYLGLAYIATNRYGEGQQIIASLQPKHVDPRSPWLTVGRLSALCGMHYLAGEFSALRRDAQRLLQVVEEHGMVASTWISYGLISLGFEAYERADLAQAADYFSQLVRLKYQANPIMYLNAVIGLAVIAAVQGLHAEAASYEQEAHAFAIEEGSVAFRNQALGCSVRLALLRHDHATALALARQIQPNPHFGLSVSFAFPQLTQIVAFIVAGSADEHHQAAALLEQAQHHVLTNHSTRVAILVLTVQALLHQARHQTQAALAALQQAIQLAEPRAMIRSFVDFGPLLVPLLNTLAQRGVAPDYLKRIMMAAERSGIIAESAPMTTPPLDRPEVLTRRETEILALLAARWSSKEIADHLIIAPNTVRKHTSTIYSKLGVSSRREAVAAARALGMLPPE